MYVEGAHVPPSNSKAVELFREAAELGYAEAQVALAEMLEAGDGVDIDLQQAIHWYKEAASQGSADAQYCLGV
jgi:uncharacterized protein